MKWSVYNRPRESNKQYANYHFWNYTNHPTVLYSPDVIKQKVDYIHENAGIVLKPHHYLYCSACEESYLRVIPF